MKRKNLVHIRDVTTRQYILHAMAVADKEISPDHIRITDYNLWHDVIGEVLSMFDDEEAEAKQQIEALAEYVTALQDKRANLLEVIKKHLGNSRSLRTDRFRFSSTKKGITYLRVQPYKPKRRKHD